MSVANGGSSLLSLEVNSAVRPKQSRTMSLSDKCRVNPNVLHKTLQITPRQGAHGQLLGGSVWKLPDPLLRGLHRDHSAGRVLGDERGGLPQDREEVRQGDGHRIPHQVRLFRSCLVFLERATLHSVWSMESDSCCTKWCFRFGVFTCVRKGVSLLVTRLHALEIRSRFAFPRDLFV